MTERRPRPSMAAMKSTIKLLRENGMQPTAMDTMPDGTIRWHFTTPQAPDVDDLDRELEAFEARHGYGRA
jgi:hypothetical protein